MRQPFFCFTQCFCAAYNGQGVIIIIIHIVSAGETIYSVAARYGVDPSLLSINNGIYAPEGLAVGQSLIIVFPKLTYTVQDGDSVYSIAGRFGISTGQIYRNNLVLSGLPDIYAGQTLILELERDGVSAFQTGGYAYPYASEFVLRTALPAMGLLMPFTYGFTLEGKLLPPDDARLLQYASEYGTKPILHLSTMTESGNFSTELASELLNNKALWEVLTDNILLEIREKGYGGLDIDFEYLGADNAEKYAMFVAYCREKLNQSGYPVMVALAPKTRDDQPGVLYEGHDYALLGQAANSVLLMTYEWGYTYGPPMAVSPIMPVTRVVEYAVERIPAEKIFLGISNYGYDFTLPYIAGVSMAQSLSTVEATQLAQEVGAEIMFDQTAMSPFFDYTKDGVWHQVWYEDARSINSRLQLIRQYGLKGALYWNLDRPNPQNLTLIASTVEILPPSLF